MASGHLAGQAQAGTLRAGWYPLLILTLAYTCHFVDRSVISIVVEPVKREFQLSDARIGLLSGLAYAVPFAIASIPVGILIDRRNRRNLLALLVGVWSGLTILSGLAGNFAALLGARMAVGMAEAGGAPTALSLISDTFARKVRATAISIYYLSVPIGTGISFVIGGMVAAHHGWRAAFLVAGAPGVMLALAIFLTLREPARGATEEDAPAGIGDEAGRKVTFAAFWREVRGQAALLHMAAGLIVSNLMLSAYLVWIATFLVRRHGFALDEAGLAVGLGAGACGAAGSALGGVAGDWLARGRLGRLARVPAAVSPLILPVAALMVWTASAPVAVGLVMALAFLLNLHFGPSYGVIVSLASASARGVTMAAVQVGTNLISFGLGPLIVGALSDRLGGPDPLGSAILILCSSSLWAAFHYHKAAAAIGPGSKGDNCGGGAGQGAS